MSKEDSPPESGPPPSDSPVQYVVRRYTVHDVPLDLFKYCKKLSPQFVEHIVMEEDALTFVLYKNGGIVGFASIYDSNARMPTRFRDGKERFTIGVFCSNEPRQGYGTRILDAIEAYARSQGKTRLDVLSLPEAKDFYVKNGFTPTIQGVQGLAMEKILVDGGRRRRKTRRRRRVR